VSRAVLVLTYHAVDAGPAPLCVDPGLFREHLDVLADAGARTMTVSELAAAVRSDELPTGAVAITFDDGFVTVAEHALPMLLERGQTATVFAVAGALGGRNDWSSQPPGAPTRPLASVHELGELARAGIEIGSHGFHHAPLTGANSAVARREVLGSREHLEQSLGRPVRSFAYPYGAAPTREARQLVRDTYDAGCATQLATVKGGVDPLWLPRVDVHYVRRPERLRRAFEGSLEAYLLLRRTGARTRRVVRKDYRRAPVATPSTAGTG
jgi:peptidoglycan/xylan/chitin deacetylase (PgdA/CDA1 family)